MIKLYHAGPSVCSIKVRLGLAEKEIEWESCPIDIRKGEQYDPEYLKLNPNAVVPTLVHDDFVVIESSIILEYLDSLSDHNVLMPEATQEKTSARIWLLRCLDIHSAINTMTFSTVNREKILSAQTPEQIEKSIASMPNPLAAEKRGDLLANGIASLHLYGAFFTLNRLLGDMQNILEKTAWLTGEQYGIVDTAILAYVDRLDRLGMAGLWQNRTPAVNDWLNQSRARPSYNIAIDPFINQKETDGARKIGDSLWPEVNNRWQDFLQKSGDN